MCADEVFDEDESPFVLGPIRKQRWIYSCAKQLLDRVIWAYGKEHGLRFTLFRPFNWIGPRLDSLETAKIGSSRVVTQFIGELIRGEDLRLVSRITPTRGKELNFWEQLLGNVGQLPAGLGQEGQTPGQ